MTDESAKAGVRGHLPPWPRKALNNSVIAMEQAYRQRKGLPLLSDADIEALKAGRPMAWESGNGGATPVAASPAVPAAAAPPAPAAVATPAPAPTAGLGEDVAKWVAEGRKWSKSTIAAEQARRGRKGLPALNDAETAALLGEQPADAPAAPAAVPTAAAPAAPRPAAAKAAPASAAASVARSGESTSYVGTPAVGTSRAAAAGGVASVGPENSEVNQQRRR